jgi:hypothetical protein
MEPAMGLGQAVCVQIDFGRGKKTSSAEPDSASRIDWFGASAAGEALHQGHFVSLSKQRFEISDDFFPDKYTHMLTQVALLIDNPELQARELPVKVTEDLANRCANRSHICCLMCIGPQG